MTLAQSLIAELVRRDVDLSVSPAGKLVLEFNEAEPLPDALLDRVREAKPQIIDELRKTAGVPLTSAEIEKYRSLDGHSRAVLENFTAAFPDSTIQWCEKPKPPAAELDDLVPPEGVRYVLADIDACRRRGHHFKIVHPRSKPLTAHLLCDTCTERTGISHWLAFGEPQLSTGERITDARWLHQHSEEITNEENSDDSDSTNDDDNNGGAA